MHVASLKFVLSLRVGKKCSEVDFSTFFNKVVLNLKLTGLQLSSKCYAKIFYFKV